jgi:hypothetical protein
LNQGLAALLLFAVVLIVLRQFHRSLKLMARDPDAPAAGPPATDR